jgi:Uma2 family endonuclease
MVAAPERIRMLPDREQVLSMSYEEFVARVEEGAHAEWVAGEAIVFMAPKERHQALVFFLALLVGSFVDLLRLGIVRTAPYGMRATPNGPLREPDLLFLAQEHRDRLTDDGLAGPADLVIEIISDESLRRDRADKFYEYQEAGIPEYWLFDPRPGKERADFYQLNVRGKYDPIHPDAEGRFHSSVIPSLWLKPEWLWQEPLPRAVDLLHAIAPNLFPDPGPAPAR